MPVSGASSAGLTATEFRKWVGDDIQSFTQEVAEEVLRDNVASGVFTTTPTVVTDGVVGRDYRSVKPYGRIEFVSTPGLGDAVRTTLELLRALSPVLTGRYRDSHIVLLNGEGVTGGDLSALDRAKAGDRVQIVNTQPYARKIEGQRAKRRKSIKGRRGLSKQASGGVYRKVLTILQQRFGRTLFVDYKLERLNIGGIETRTRAAISRSKGGFYTYPVLQFYFKPTIN